MGNSNHHILLLDQIKHANFILNEGSASAGDIEALIQHVQREVLRAHGVALEPECRIVGEAA